MESRLKILGHPAHQTLIVLPMGLLFGAVAFDLIYLFGGDEVMAVVAYWMIVSGLVAGLIAAPFGTVDWLAIPRGTRAKRVGAAHGFGNIVVVMLFLASWLLRRHMPEDPMGLAIALSLAGGALAVVTGWLGGELVNRLGVGIPKGAHLDAPSSLSDSSSATTSETRRPKDQAARSEEQGSRHKDQGSRI